MREYADKTKRYDRMIDVIRGMGGYIDAHGMLQLNKGLLVGEAVPPHGRVFQKWADMVVAEYGERGLLEAQEEEGRMLHQFRMYIDRHNITYIRNYFKEKGMTDEEALESYVFASNECGGLNGRKMLREPARFHNKYPSGSSYWRYQKGRENKKRLTPDFHSEFILDQEGRFVSQWNVLEMDVNGQVISDIDYYRKRYEIFGQNEEVITDRYRASTGDNALYETYTWEDFQRQIMDTESFNYASANDTIHKRLDIQPPGRLDTDLRRQIAREWKSPVKYLYNYHSDKGDAYSESNS